MPQPLGYYGVKCEPETEAAIDALDLNSICGLLAITSDQIGDECIDDSYEGIHTRIKFACDRLPTPQKLSLVKALCDRIEAKLMEIAK